MIKRLLDFILAGITLILLLPCMGGLWFIIRLTLGYPALFRQTRPGLHGRPFTMYKFRTMTDGYDEQGKPLPDAERMTAFGKWLRSTSLDELPELWNVIKGDMSLVGPRPLLMQYLDRYTPEQMRRHDVKPGITGWAQIHGRNAISWEERFQLDIWYVDHRSLWLDMKILCITFWTVLTREGIQHAGHVTMQEFQGQGEHKDS
jgi:sugar transferase EpsL